LTDRTPARGERGEVFLGHHQRALVLVDFFPAVVWLGWFAQYQVEADEPLGRAVELWSRTLAGGDVERQAAASIEFPGSSAGMLPREFEIGGELAFEVNDSTEFLVAFKVDGKVLAERLVVVWSRPG
jgi:hypothetical protein